MAGRESFKPSGKLSSIDSEQYPEEVSIDLDNEDPNAFEIVEEDDTPEADRGKPRELDYTAVDDEELTGVADKTKKRINRLRYETETERRGREAAERERDAAVDFARNQATELEELRRRVTGGSTALAASMKESREAKLADAKRRLSAAHADGDSDAIAAATSDISQAQSELMEIQRNTPKAPAEGERQPQRQAEPQRQAAPQIEPNVAAWISNNSWFGRGAGKDEAKTEFALSLDKTIRRRGISPASEEYTRELDKGMKAMYPDHKPFARANDDDGGEARREPRRTNVQAEGGRTNDRQESARKVTLTATEVALAKRLRIPLQAYAAEKLKRANKGDGA